jgi:shikimate kinase
MALSLASNRVILTGFMGCGKSYFASRLADILDYDIYDTDTLIVKKTSRSISDIFNNDGEDTFRALEADIADDIKAFKEAVIATGGGFPIYYKDICSLGTVIYMDIEFDDIVSRMNEDDFIKRPLFQDIDKARALFLERKSIYEERSHFKLNASQDIALMLEDVVNFLKT